MRPPASTHAHPAVLVIFGAAGDLTQRKLAPALYNLFLDGWLPEQFAVVGVDRTVMTEEAFRQRLREGLGQFSRRGKPKAQDWDRFAPRLSYLPADLTDAASFAKLEERLAGNGAGAGEANHIFYLATAPTLFEGIARNLTSAGLIADRQRTRVVFEKPFGRDLASAIALNRALTGLLAESQIYRIDHYLGKETVQNILALRFANSLFEPIWDRRYIDHVQITVAETVGVGHRGGYYDHAGALRDMIQNHLLQILCCIAMESPVSFQADEIRNKKTDVLQAVRPIPKDRLGEFAVRGQYGAGEGDGRELLAYRHEPNVDADSATETYVALKLFVDNWRWQGVPFYLRTGKSLPTRVSEVVVQFRPVPHRAFPAGTARQWLPNCLVLHIQPQEDIVLRFQAKEPGPDFRLRPVSMHFDYGEEFSVPTPEAYETLLMDALEGDATLHMRADQVEAAWAVVEPILEGWAETPPADFPNYPAGSWGPEAADALLARDGHKWLPPASNANATNKPGPQGHAAT